MFRSFSGSSFRIGFFVFMLSHFCCFCYQPTMCVFSFHAVSTQLTSAVYGYVATTAGGITATLLKLLAAGVWWPFVCVRLWLAKKPVASPKTLVCGNRPELFLNTNRVPSIGGKHMLPVAAAWQGRSRPGGCHKFSRGLFFSLLLGRAINKKQVFSVNRVCVCVC